MSMQLQWDHEGMHSWLGDQNVKAETLKTYNCWQYNNYCAGGQAYYAWPAYTSSGEQFITRMVIQLLISRSPLGLPSCTKKDALFHS